MRVRKNQLGFVVGDLTIRTLTELPNAVRALKKPIAISAVKIDEAFQVETTEGLMNGKAGDWLMQGVSGELYICPDDIFVKSYDIL